MEVTGAHLRPRGGLFSRPHQTPSMTKNEFRTSVPAIWPIDIYGWCSRVFFSQQHKSPAAQTTQDTKVKIKRNQ